MAVSSRIDLKNYCLRKLGAPVMAINVAPEQVEDRIDDALERFWEYHGDGSVREFINHTIVAEDVTNGWIPVPDHILSVLRVLPLSGMSGVNNIEYQAYISDVIGGGMTTGGLTSYVVDMSYLELLNQFFSREKRTRFNQHFDKVFVETDWSLFELGSTIVLECYRLADPETYRQVYNDPWLKAYATALIKKQWGQNMIKYDGFQLPSGMTLNGRAIYEDANNDLISLEQDLFSARSLPIDFMMG